jgi:hypothetical protein
MAGKHRSSSTDSQEERVMVTLSSALRRQMQAIAASNERSLSGEIRIALMAHVAAWDAEAA